MKDQLKKAFDLANNEVEEKQIENLKNIIKTILQKKKDKEQEIEELQEDVKILKQDIDDFKAGRLDKVKERHEVDPKANSVAPIQITIINDNKQTQYPNKPWYWRYDVVWGYQYPTLTTTGSYQTLTTAGTNAVYYYSGSGTTTAVNTVGTYNVNGGIINLN